jgi:hypothetical protein
MSTITVEQMKSKVDEWHAKRSEIDVIKETLEEKNSELRKIDGELFAMMEELNLKKFEGNLGKVQLIEQDYVNMPEDEEKKALFFDHLKEIGEFDQLITVNYQKLNSWHKNKREELGEFYSPPGLEMPKTLKQIRKGR